MIERSFDGARLEELMEPFLPLEGFHPPEWLMSSGNVCLIDSHDNVSLFEQVKPGVFYGHYFFKDRGKAAVESAENFLEMAFRFAEVIIGLTPIENKAAKWMSRRIGFKSHGQIETAQGDCELFILTKKEYKDG